MAALLLAAVATCMIKSVDTEIIVDTDEDDRRLDPLHTNVSKFATLSTPLPKRQA